VWADSKVNKGRGVTGRGADMDHEFNLTWLAACYRLPQADWHHLVTGTLHVYPVSWIHIAAGGLSAEHNLEKPAPPPT